MNITNKHNLTEETLEIAKRSCYRPKEDILRVTELIGPPMIRHLTLKHWDNLEIDASELLWSLFGTNVHARMESLQRFNIIKEFSMAVKLKNGMKVKGTVDLVDMDALRIVDYKTSSVWKAIYGEFEDYEAQINLYHLLMTQVGFPEMASGRNILFLKDWVVSKAKFEENYPPTQEFVVNYDLWPLEDTEKYLMSRVAAHTSDKVPTCTPKERWESETVYAVKKQGRKSALPGGLKKDLAEAEAMATAEGGYVETRPGTCRRCLEYCAVRSLCPFGKKLLAGQT